MINKEQFSVEGTDSAFGLFCLKPPVTTAHAALQFSFININLNLEIVALIET